jgi:SNF2 family DNA or RNA helicase
MNIDSVKTTDGAKTIERFFEVHGEKTMWAIDESQSISNHSADRTKRILKLADQAGYKRIYTGTPISKSVANLWAQFAFLDESILQQSNFFAFRSRYCVMGGFGGKQIVGSRNIEHLNSLMIPYSFRITKREALDLPEKIHIVHKYKMDEKTKLHYDNISMMLMTTLASGKDYDVNGAAVGLLRCQQVVCGMLPHQGQDAVHKDEWTYEIISDQRIDELVTCINKFDENNQIVIWSRFRNDIKRIIARLESEYGADSCVQYHGGRNSAQRQEAKDLFRTNQRRFFVGNQATSAGLDGLQDNCFTVIYFSNDHNYIHRVQSEDRNHRGGTKYPVTYVDMVAVGSCDAGILNTLRRNRNLSDLTLDEIRMALDQSDEN